MVGVRRNYWVTGLLVFAAIAAAVIAGVKLRTDGPFSSPVLPAEDSFTHMALVREHMRDGKLDPLNPGARLYPPGMHAFIAAAWVYTGLDLYELVRFLPILWGALAIAGVGLLLLRSAGPVGAFVGALAMAVAPEVILRTTMLAPTALDIALMPFLFYALVETVKGRLWWGGVAGVITLFLVYMHPWLLGILGTTGLLFVAFSILWPWPASRGRPLTALGIATATAVVGVGLGLSLSGCGTWCGPSFEDVVPDDFVLSGAQLRMAAPLITVGSLLVASLFVLSRRGLDRFLNRPIPETAPVVSRGVASALLAVLVVVTAAPALMSGMPRFVDPHSMFGYPILALAAFALVALPFVPSPAANMGAALAFATYPFVLYNPLHSEFWPHRTAVYLGIGLCILAGVAGSLVVRGVREGVEASQRTSPGASRWARRSAVLLVPVVVAVCLGGTVYAATPDPVGWYHLYEPCEFTTLQDAAAQATANPYLHVITGDWESKLVLAALATNASRIWYKNDFFTSEAARDEVLRWHPVLVITDKYLYNETPSADTSFLSSSPYQEVGRSCAAGDNPPVVLYAAARGAHT